MGRSPGRTLTPEDDMQAKKKVLVRFPKAHLVEVTSFHWSVMSGEKQERTLDITNPDERAQGKTIAWRSACFWMHRNPETVKQLVEAAA